MTTLQIKTGFSGPLAVWTERYRSPSECLGNIRLRLVSTGKLQDHRHVDEAFTHCHALRPVFLRFCDILRTIYHAHNGWQVGIIRPVPR